MLGQSRFLKGECQSLSDASPGKKALGNKTVGIVCVCVQSLEDLDSSLQQGTQDKDELQDGQAGKIRSLKK